MLRGYMSPAFNLSWNSNAVLPRAKQTVMWLPCDSNSDWTVRRQDHLHDTHSHTAFQSYPRMLIDDMNTEYFCTLPCNISQRGVDVHVNMKRFPLRNMHFGESHGSQSRRSERGRERKASAWERWKRDHRVTFRRMLEEKPTFGKLPFLSITRGVSLFAWGGGSNSWLHRQQKRLCRSPRLLGFRDPEKWTSPGTQ